jgi:hypothetical protein
MNPEFGIRIQKLEPSLQRLLASAPRLLETVPANPPMRGIYVFFEDEETLYVGRSNNIGKQLTGRRLAKLVVASGLTAWRVQKVS